MSEARKIIMNSKYREFPETLTTLELCRAFAQKDRRKVGESLRKCAAALAAKVSNKNLRNTLEDMSRNLFPETEIVRIRGCIQRVESKLSKEIQDVIFTEHDFDEMRRVEKLHEAAKAA